MKVPNTEESKLTDPCFFISASDALVFNEVLAVSKGLLRDCSSLSLTRSNASILISLPYAWSAIDCPPFVFISSETSCGACPLSVSIERKAGFVVAGAASAAGSGAGAASCPVGEAKPMLDAMVPGVSKFCVEGETVEGGCGEANGAGCSEGC